MNFFDPNIGEIEVPDGVPDDVRNQAFQRLQQQQATREAIQGGMGMLGRTIADVISPQQTYPVISHRAAAAMTPQMLQTVMGQQQQVLSQQNEMAARQQMQREQQAQYNKVEQARQRMQTQEMMQREKDRNQQLKLEEQRMKNRAEEQKLNMEMRKQAEQERMSRPELDKTRGVQWQMNPETGQYEQQILDQNLYNYSTRMGSGRSGGGGGGGTSSRSATRSGGINKTALEGFVQEPRPDGSMGWANPYTGEALSDEQYQQKLAIENAWSEKQWDGKQQNYYRENLITGEIRYIAGDPSGTGAGVVTDTRTPEQIEYDKAVASARQKSLTNPNIDPEELEARIPQLLGQRPVAPIQYQTPKYYEDSQGGGAVQGTVKEKDGKKYMFINGEWLEQ